MKKSVWIFVVVMLLSLCMAAFSACSVGGDSGNKPNDSSINSESYRESNISGDDKESESVSETQTGSESDKTSESESGETSESESESGEESVHTHKFERNADERYLKSSATCEKRAEYYFSCKCGEMGMQTFEYGDLLPHTEAIDTEIKATCISAGLSAGKHCSVCNKVLEAKIAIPALGHDLAMHEGKASTCTEKGYAVYETCRRCDYTTYRELPLAEHELENGICKNCGKEITPHTHIEVIDEGKPATCLESGLTDGKHCSVCNKILEEQQVIPALGHDFLNYVCTRCGYTQGCEDHIHTLYGKLAPEMDKDGNYIIYVIDNVNVYSFGNMVTSCDSKIGIDGYYICEECGKNILVKVKPDHDYADGVCTRCGYELNCKDGVHILYGKPAPIKDKYNKYIIYYIDGTKVFASGNELCSCDSDVGVNGYYICEGCSERINVKVKPAHNYVKGICTSCNLKSCDEDIHVICGEPYDSKKAYVYEGIIADQARLFSNITYSCSEPATGTIKCELCSSVLLINLIFPHEIVYHEGKEVTCTEFGYASYETCANCDYSTYEEIPALGHNLSFYSSKAATCTEAGYKAYETCSRCGYTTYEEIPALGHDLVLQNAKAPTCTEDGCEVYEFCSRCDYTTDKVVIPALGHDTVSHQGRAATCNESGWADYETCSRCSYTTYKTLPALGHNYVDGKCTRCGAGDGATYSREGNYVYFGSYPQTKVSDETLLNTLNAKAGELPTEENSYLWTSYGYYISGSVKDYMWYIDDEVDGSKYRGVYFTSYRPYPCDDGSYNTFQDDNGYFERTTYWFKYEGIKWRVLTESGNRAFLMCDIAIDSQQYYHDNNKIMMIDDKTIYANNYAESEIRKWLNETFYNTAFNDLQKAIIRTTSVDNSARSTSPYNELWNKGENEYACENTLDKVFLLSEYEVTNPDYGFSESTSWDETRQLKSSDYAKSQGCYQSSEYNGNCSWRLRSPSYDCNSDARNVSNYGKRSYGSVDRTGCGVVPALWIAL